jgi:hypothetical protein
MTTKNTRRVYPLPEAIDGRRWSVDDGRPQVDTTARRMLVPLQDTDGDRFIRAHEMAHARITPKVGAGKAAKKAGVTLMALQVAEDARVHHFLNRRGIPTPGGMTPEEAQSCAKRIVSNDRDMAAALLSSHGTGDFELLRHGLLESGADHDALLETIRDVRRIAEGIGRRADRRGGKHPCDNSRGFATRTIPAALQFDTLWPEEPGDADDGMRDKLSELIRNVSMSARDGKWGTVDPIARAPMSIARRRGKGETRTYRDEGTAPSAVHRLTIDGRIFSRQRHAPGGTVLVDASGSMALSAEQLAAIVEAAPTGKVAIYCGRSTSGRITVVADRGRMATDKDMRRARVGGGNVIDGPALRWLANQPKPRIWVSDGYVTGKNDAMAMNLIADAAGIVRRGSITRVDAADDAADMLRAARGVRRR